MKKNHLLTLLLIVFFNASVANAHSMLEQASPRVGSVVKKSPAEVRLRFTEPLEPRFSKVEVRSPSGALIAKGGVDRGKGDELVAPLHALALGQYQVIWKVISVDSHPTEGNFTFEVKP
jgi:copper resistance protein C